MKGWAFLQLLLVHCEARGAAPLSSRDACHDSTVLLQRSHEAVGSVLASTAVSPSIQGPTCSLDDLNSGTCSGSNTCFACDLQGTQALLPTNATRFPDSRLLCEGDDSSTCSQLTTSQPISFKDPSQVLVCKGTGTCRDVWKVLNVGAVCCSSPSGDGQTCYEADFQLQSTPLCQNDVCCDGSLVCTNSSLTGVESILCKGRLACSETTVSLERDLYCNETSDVAANSGGTCSSSSFTFTGSEHVVDCLGNGVCSSSSFGFPPASEISMLCNSQAIGTGGGSGGACTGAVVDMALGACLDLNCSQDEDCVGMVVNENGGSCYFLGPENAPNRPADCEAVNATKCGPIQPEPICCRDDPNCGSCCEEPSTTTTQTFPDPTATTTAAATTTNTTAPPSTSAPTTTTKKKPYSSYRRIRRQNRRNRRQQRRDYREYQYGM